MLMHLMLGLGDLFCTSNCKLAVFSIKKKTASPIESVLPLGKLLKKMDCHENCLLVGGFLQTLSFDQIHGVRCMVPGGFTRFVPKISVVIFLSPSSRCFFQAIMGYLLILSSPFLGYLVHLGNYGLVVLTDQNWSRFLETSWT